MPATIDLNRFKDYAMTFQHDCFNDREARAYRESRLSGAAPGPVFGIFAHGYAIAIGVIAPLLAVLFWWSGVPLLAVVVLAVIGGVFLFGGITGKLAVDEHRAYIRAVVDELTPASNSDLEWLAEKGKAFPDVAAEVRRWVADSRTIRERDMRAVRAYLVGREPSVRRQELLDRLAGQ